MVQRIVHIVPEVQDLAAGKGLQAAPAGYNSSPADLNAMRDFANAFHPWGERWKWRKQGGCRQEGMF